MPGSRKVLVMNLLQAIFMGLIQGLTEFLPVSSSGHLAIFQQLFGIETDTGVLFEVLLHLGTLIAVCIVFWKDFKNLFVHGIGLVVDVCVNGWTFFMNKVKKENRKYRRLITNAYRKFAALIIVTTIPTGIIGVVFSGLIEKASETLIVPGICLVLTAIILLLVDGRPNGRKKAKATGYKDAALIGVAQGVATLPGISRSGSTIAACLFLGLDRSFAVKYSFLASIPAIVGANILQLRHIGDSAINGGLVFNYIIGMIVAGVVGFVCIKLMINVVKRAKYEYFAYYCAVIGVIAIFCYFFIK